MAKETSATQNLEQHRKTLTKARFDSHGVRKAAIALLLEIHREGRMSTVAEVLVALEAVDSHLAGSPHSLKSLSEKLEIPYTSVSRIVFSLTSEAEPGGILRLVPDKADRRRKHIEIDLDTFKRSGAQLRALEQAMVDYYGSSVTRLKKARSKS